MFEKFDTTLDVIGAQNTKTRVMHRQARDTSKLKKTMYPGIKLFMMKKVSPVQLELNPYVDATPRDMSISATSLNSSVSSIFLSPARLEKICNNKLVKVKEKLMKSNSEFSHDLNLGANEYQTTSSGKQSIFITSLITYI